MAIDYVAYISLATSCWEHLLDIHFLCLCSFTVSLFISFHSQALPCKLLHLNKQKTSVGSMIYFPFPWFYFILFLMETTPHAVLCTLSSALYMPVSFLLTKRPVLWILEAVLPKARHRIWNAQ